MLGKVAIIWIIKTIYLNISKSGSYLVRQVPSMKSLINILTRRGRWRRDRSSFAVT